MAKFIALPSIINTCVVARLCTDFEIDGEVSESYMTADMTISCLDADYKGFIKPYAAGMGCSIVGFELSVFYLVLKMTKEDYMEREKRSSVNPVFGEYFVAACYCPSF